MNPATCSPALDPTPLYSTLYGRVPRRARDLLSLSRHPLSLSLSLFLSGVGDTAARTDTVKLWPLEIQFDFKVLFEIYFNLSRFQVSVIPRRFVAAWLDVVLFHFVDRYCLLHKTLKSVCQLNNEFSSGSEAGSYLRLKDFGITQL